MAQDDAATATAEAPEEAPAAEETSESKGRRFKLGGQKTKLLVLLLVVMAGEAGAIYWFLPGPANQPQASGDGDADSLNVDDVELVEVELGQFNVTNRKAAPGSVLHISFTLFAVVAKDQQVAFDLAANTEHKARVRQAVDKVVRSSNLDDISDPSLSTIKRLIREEINKVLRKSYVVEVVIDGFKTLEQ